MECLLCRKPLKPVHEETFQPWDGGEVQFIFSYGSCKFDKNLHSTVFRAYVCDDCAEPLVPRMQEMTK